MIEEVYAPPELSGEQGILIMASEHSLINLAYWQDEVQSEFVDHVYHEAREDCECCVFEISQLDVHRPELHTPSNVTVD